MNEDNFEKKVERELQSMSSEQVVFFAWLCALRALPYIGAKGNFNCWKKKERQKHLYALFRDLDANCYYRAVYVTDIHAYGGAAAARDQPWRRAEEGVLRAHHPGPRLFGEYCRRQRHAPDIRLFGLFGRTV